jgi:DNA-directed RNA polymerase beta' subunit
VIKIGGKETTLGRLLIAQHLPVSVKGDAEFAKLLQNPDFELVKHSKGPLRVGVHDMLEAVAKNDPKNFANTVDALKNLGNNYSYELGFSFGLKDLHVDKALRAHVLKKYDAEADVVKSGKGTQAEKDDKLVDIYDRATTELVKANEPGFKSSGNRIYQMVDSGARGKMSQFRQMTIAPMLMKGRFLVRPSRRRSRSRTRKDWT